MQIHQSITFLRVFMTFLLVSKGLQVFGQKTIRIVLNSNIEDDKTKKTQAIIPVYKYVSTSIEPYDNFGIVESSKSDWIKINKMPDLTGCVDTGYTFIYFSGANTEKNQGYILAIIGNYYRSRLTVQFHIDKNNNLDFTDDGPPVYLPFDQNSFSVGLKNIAFPESNYQVKFSRIEFGKNMAYKNLLDDHYKKRSGNKVFTKINNCYREQRFNICSDRFKNETDSFVIAIKDMNVNALYNDDGIDAVFIGPYNQEIVSEDLIKYKSGKSKAEFEWNEKKFYIEKIDPLGKWIEIREAGSHKKVKRLRKCRKTPKFSFMTEMNEKHSIKDFKRKNVYLYFWNDDLASLEADTSYLRKIQKEFGNKIQVIGMNYGDEPKSMRFFQQYYRINWLIGMSNKEINTKYYVENLPKTYWLGKRRRLKERNISPKDLYLKLENKYKKSK
ncbi:MAG: hypothetical protein H6605_01220 [Flavobacteriales bacterium]|nr:hypothetical protein [Flavobacteriales bacterium]